MKYSLICLNIVCFWGCKEIQNKSVTTPEVYKFAYPDTVWQMPAELDEISGIAPFKDQFIACINDEKGKIYFYHPQHKAVEKTISFTDRGDFEDIVILESEAYILESKGVLWKVSVEDDTTDIVQYKLNLGKGSDAEGLTYDAPSNRLLIALKNKIKNAHGQKVNAIFTFDLNAKAFSQTPLITWDLDEYGTKDNFASSALAIHPISREIYIISSIGKKMFVVDWNGQLQQIIPLDYKHFTQPEGMYFDSLGNVYISNEGKQGTGNILKFDIKKPIRYE